MKKRPKILLVNPYIYDFAAYDLWLKPLGLLYLAAILEENGADPILIDCMDREHPSVLALQNRSRAKSRRHGQGYFYREKVEKPVEFSHIPRNYSRYGMPPAVLEDHLQKIQAEHDIKMILVTSGMTYWFQGALEATSLCRKYFPRSKILLGGIYATLCPEHARANSQADYVFTGEAERKILEFAQEIVGLVPQKKYGGYDDFPHPAYHLYSKLNYVAMMTSRGCPYSCSFCATHEFTSSFKRREPDKVIAEIGYYRERFGVKDVAFYDDALFVNAQKHIKPILRGVIEREWSLYFHTPNGLFPRLIDEELAALLVESGFKTIRLSYETKNPERQKQMRKVRDCHLEKALELLEKQGFPPREVTVYLIMGLPGQTPREVEESLLYVHGLGAKVSLSSFSPIPRTQDWQLAVDNHGFPPNQPLLTNKSIYPLHSEIFPIPEFERLKKLAIKKNEQVITQNMDKAEKNISDYNVYA